MCCLLWVFDHLAMTDNSGSRILQFKFFLESTTLEKDWCRWKRSVEFYLVAHGITDPTVKQATLFYLGGLELQDIFYSLPNCGDLPEDLDIYNYTIQLLDAHFISESDAIGKEKTATRDASKKGTSSKQGKSVTKPNQKQKNVYVMLIELKKTKPKIWRRIEVPADYTFFDLHVAIQDAFGWKNKCVYAFTVRNQVTGEDDIIDVEFYQREEFHPDARLSETVGLWQYFRTVNDKGEYSYDFFGDPFDHAIKLEKIITMDTSVKYPKCVAGAQVNLPEDSDGEDVISTKFDPNAIIFRNPKKVENYQCPI